MYDLYVGHTTNFTKRKTGHKNACINENNKAYNYKVYQKIREFGGWENWTMVEIEKYPCNDFHEASARERFWYEELNADLNSVIPHRGLKEYSDEYYENNKNIIREKKKNITKITKISL